MMNVQMWVKALKIIPHVSKEEWARLDIISRWLVASRAAVLVMTVTSTVIAGLLAAMDSTFYWWRFVLLLVGLAFAHATNNLVNDLTDSRHGVDKDNYFRTLYGPQPLEAGLLTKSQMVTYARVTGGIAAACGVILILTQQVRTGGNPWITLLMMGLGAFFVLFYTWPLKFFALGELSVFLVWGPLMIGGGYYVITGAWDWRVVIAGLPYALGVTTVIFGKHIDKIDMDKARGIHTLPVLLGERIARYATVGMFSLQYLIVIYLVVINFFSPILLIVLFALPTFFKVLPPFRAPRPAEKPADYPDIWPNYFVASAFVHNRQFGLLYLVSLILESILKLII
jgi:1,4-dihydroxy-2-naphthoate octaprenyltransferase